MNEIRKHGPEGCWEASEGPEKTYNLGSTKEILHFWDEVDTSWWQAKEQCYKKTDSGRVG